MHKEAAKKDCRVLHFEDNEFLGEMYGVKLSKEGFAYKHYAHPPKSKEELIKLVIDYNPDLIIMDIIMPVMDGEQATKHLKTDDKTKKIPILGICNIQHDEDIKSFIKAGMTDYLINAHYLPSEVIAIIRSLLTNPESYKPQYNREK
ncbi:MAG: response regulator [Patescibacteria group bacterium]